MKDTGKMIKEIAAEEGITMKDLAERLNITRQALYKRLDGDLRTSSFLGIMEAMGFAIYYGKDGKAKKLQ